MRILIAICIISFAAFLGCSKKCERTFSVSMMHAMKDDEFNVLINDTLKAAMVFEEDWFWRRTDSLKLLDNYCAKTERFKVTIRQLNTNFDTTFWVDKKAVRGVYITTTRSGNVSNFNMQVDYGRFYDSLNFD